MYKVEGEKYGMSLNGTCLLYTTWWVHWLTGMGQGSHVYRERETVQWENGNQSLKLTRAAKK